MTLLGWVKHPRGWLKEFSVWNTCPLPHRAEVPEASHSCLHPQPAAVLNAKRDRTMPSFLGTSILALFKPSGLFFPDSHKSISQSSLVCFWEVKWGYTLFLQSPSSFYYVKSPPTSLEWVDVQSCSVPVLLPSTTPWAKAAGKTRIIGRSHIWNVIWL